MYYATYDGLHKWCDHSFTHLGYMILANDQGRSGKVKSYVKSIQHLHEALEESIDVTHDEDRKRDLKILLHNVKIFEKTVNRLFKSVKSSRK
jgi:hypothetical protein